MSILIFLASVVLAIGWLLPVHQLPWSAFHTDAWVAGVLLILSWGVLLTAKIRQPWPYPALFVASLSLVPLIQFSFGQIMLAGTAWISSIYLLGFLLAILAGARWESFRSGEAADSLFFAVGCAAIASVGLQLCQWLNLSERCFCSGPWIFAYADNSRISANLAQPNQLATLLIWGVLAFSWGWTRQIVRAPVAVAGIIFLLFGLALTESRTGALSLALLVLCVWLWLRVWPSKWVAVVASLLWGLYMAMVVFLDPLNQALLLDYSSSIVSRTKSETRLEIWAMFLKAVWQHPWTGYGWNQTLVAQVITAPPLAAAHRMQGMLFSYAHSLFLDLILWVGIPLGLTVCSAITYWLWRTAQAIKSSQDLLLLMVVLGVSVHAMLELPLYCAYFLLPFGLVVGVLAIRLRQPQLFFSSSRITVVVWLVVSLSFILVVRDYFLAENSYADLRLEKARISSKFPRLPPDVVLLTQLRDLIILARLEPSLHTTPGQMAWIEKVALVYPTTENLLKLAVALTLNGQIVEARRWLSKLCVLYGPEQCTASRTAWTRLQVKFPELQEVQWPSATYQ